MRIMTRKEAKRRRRSNEPLPGRENGSICLPGARFRLEVKFSNRERAAPGAEPRPHLDADQSRDAREKPFLRPVGQTCPKRTLPGRSERRGGTRREEHELPS